MCSSFELVISLRRALTCFPDGLFFHSENTRSDHQGSEEQQRKQYTSAASSPVRVHIKNLHQVTSGSSSRLCGMDLSEEMIDYNVDLVTLVNFITSTKDTFDFSRDVIDSLR